MSTAVPSPEKAENQTENERTAATVTQGPSPEVLLTQMITGSLAAQAVFVAAKLGIADLLSDGPKNVVELATQTSTDAPSLYRVLRALAAAGVFREETNQVFKLTPVGDLLQSNSSRSLRDLAVFMGEDWHWQVWGSTLFSVRTGKPAWGQVHGKEVFPYFEANQEAAKIFDEAMTSLSNLAIRGVIAAYDFSEIDTLVDVAGGQGSLLTAILKENPTVRGILFDLSHVIERAREAVKAAGLDARCELATGNFFESVTAGADAYIMKHIIHDWDDERALKILTNIKKAMKAGGRVLLVESVITPVNQPDLGKWLDIEMLVSPGGKERTAEEYKELFAQAGLRMTRIIPTDSPYSVIEAGQ